MEINCYLKKISESYSKKSSRHFQPAKKHYEIQITTTGPAIWRKKIHYITTSKICWNSAKSILQSKLNGKKKAAARRQVEVKKAAELACGGGSSTHMSFSNFVYQYVQ